MKTLIQQVLTLPYKTFRNFHKIALLMFFPASLNAEQITIAAFGDSLTYGYGLAAADGFVPQLETWMLDSGADVRIINAGVSGDTTAMGLARVDWVLGDDVDAVILELGANDFLRGLSPADAQQNLDAILTILAQKNLPVLLAGMPAPSNYGAEYKLEFDAIFPELAATYDTLYYPHFMNGIAEQDGDLMRFFQRDRLHPNAAGVVHIVNDIGPFVLDLVDAAQ